MTSEGNEFVVTDAKDEFRAKAHDIFGALDAIQYAPTSESASFLKNDPAKRNNDEQPKLNHSKRDIRDRGSRSEVLLRRPVMPPPHQRPPRRRRRQQPGHMRNPQNYTKYSLSDVSDDQMSQKSNTQAALQFLNELDERKARENAEAATEDDLPSDGKIIFRKPKPKAMDKKIKEASDSGSGSSDASSMQASKPLKQKSGKQNVVLSHLEFEDE